MRSTCLAIVLIGSRIWDWYQNRWPWVTLNDKVALILHYFTEFGSFWGQFTITMSIVKVCRGTAWRQRYKYSITTRWKFCSRFINSRLNAQYLPSYRLDKKLYMSFWLVPKSVTLNDLERRNGPYFRYLKGIWYIPERIA